MSNIVKFFKLDFYRTIGSSIFLFIFVIVGMLDAVDWRMFWSFSFYLKIYFLSLVLSFPLRLMWFYIFGTKTGKLNDDYEAFLDATKIIKWF